MEQTNGASLNSRTSVCVCVCVCVCMRMCQSLFVILFTTICLKTQRGVPKKTVTIHNHCLQRLCQRCRVKTGLSTAGCEPGQCSGSPELRNYQVISPPPPPFPFFTPHSLAELSSKECMAERSEITQVMPSDQLKCSASDFYVLP